MTSESVCLMQKAKQVARPPPVCIFDMICIFDTLCTCVYLQDLMYIKKGWLVKQGSIDRVSNGP